MSHTNYITEILGIKDAEIEKVENGAREIRIQFRLSRKGMNCPHCGEYTNAVHDYRIRELRDLPLRGSPCVSSTADAGISASAAAKRAQNLSSWPAGISAPPHGWLYTEWSYPVKDGVSSPLRGKSACPHRASIAGCSFCPGASRQAFRGFCPSTSSGETRAASRSNAS